MKTLKTLIGIFLVILVSGNVCGQCIPSFSSTSDYISQVSFCTINNQTGCSTNGYGDYTNMVANVEAGESINIYIACVDDGIGSHGLAVWIDLNSNGIFDSEERIGAVNMPNNSSTTISYTIPQNQENGIYTMRVLYRYNEDANTVSPCTSGSYGEGEDYSIKIGESQIITPPEPSEWTNCFDFENNIISTRFENDNTYPWTIVNNSPSHNTYCLKSGNGGVHNSSSSIEIEVEYENSGSITFDAGIYGEGEDTYDWDKCRFYIDDVLKFNYGAHARWENFEYEVTPGTHTFKWTYKKDGSVHPTGDAFFIDNICFDADMFLPIHLLEFSVDPRYDQQTGVHVLNLLTIRTGYEYNNCEFIVYRSEDAINWDYDNPVCDWDFGRDSAIYNEALDTVLNYFTIEHPNGQTYYPVDYEPYEVTYYKLIQRDCDNTYTEYYESEIIVCIANQQKRLIEPYVICDNGPQVVGGSEVCEVFVQNVLGQVVEKFQLQPYQQREVLADIQGMYLITFVYKYNGETCKKTEKIVCW